MEFSSEYQQALYKAMTLLRYNERTCHELRERLLASKFSEETSDKVVKHLAEEGLLNDKRYAEYYLVCYKDKKSIKRIRKKLMEKGVAENVIDEVLEEADDSGAFEKALKKQLVRRKVSDISEADYPTKKKIAESLYRQGYPAEKIKNILY